MRACLTAALLAFGLAAGPATGAQPPATVSEAQAKANFLYQLALFVEWPLPPAAEVFTLCVAGSTPVLTELVAHRGQHLRGRVLSVREIRDGDDATGCQVLFLPLGDERRVTLLLEKVKEHPVLTVGEHERFLRWGGVLQLRVEQARLRFDIDLTRAETARLKVPARLLALAARVVRDGNVVKR